MSLHIRKAYCMETQIHTYIHIYICIYINHSVPGNVFFVPKQKHHVFTNYGSNHP